jgi:hypothetical protein
MFRHRVFLMVLCLCLPFLLSAEEQKTKPPEDDLKPLQGLWKGSWGGGQRDGVIFQPVLSRIGINGDRVEWRGLPFESDGSGTISLSKKGEGKYLRFSYTVKADGQVQKKTVDVPYTVKGDALTLMAHRKKTATFGLDTQLTNIVLCGHVPRTVLYP